MYFFPFFPQRNNRSSPSFALESDEVPLWHFPPFIHDHTLYLTPWQQRAEEQALTGTHGRVVAGSVLAQGSGALCGEGGGGTEAAAALPALPAGDGARAPGGPLIHLSICQEAGGKGRAKEDMHC